MIEVEVAQTLVQTLKNATRLYDAYDCAELWQRNDSLVGDLRDDEHNDVELTVLLACKSQLWSLICASGV